MSAPRLEPDDAANRALLAAVHPPDWVNPAPASRYHLVVVGGGTAGLVSAAGAAGLGARVALVERHLLGGDCLNYGCVPSKALLRSSRAVAALRNAPALGVSGGEPRVDFAAVMARVRRLRAEIAPHDSAERFRELGVDVFLGEGRFVARDALEVGAARLRFRRAIVATGARASAPDVPGLAEAGFLTHETVFSQSVLPARLAVVGGGPIGCELAQAFQRLGSAVTLIHEHGHVLDREDPDAALLVQRALARDGVRLMLDAKLLRVDASGDTRTLRLETTEGAQRVEADAILVATGRMPNVKGLGLDAAGVAFEPRRGVQVDDLLRTTNPRIFAAGDVCMAWKFTHAADFAARIALQNALFFGRRKLSALVMPWCTYTDPELAHVGLSESEARVRGVALTSFVRPLAEVDRARLDGDAEGFVKVHVARGSDRILGATIVARHAGESIGELAAAIQHRIGLGALANVIHPYPTQAEAIRQLGDAYNRTRLTPTAKRLLRAFFTLRR